MARLTLRNLGFAYGRQTLWSGLQAEWPPGSWCGLVGRNGSGKSTLLRVIAGWQRSQQGEVLLGDQVFGAAPPESRGVVLLPSRPSLYAHLSVEENVRFPLRCGPGGPDRSEELLERLDLLALRRRSPQQLSAGEQQRVAWARALLRPAKWLLADEAMSHLDGEQRERLWQLLREWLPERSMGLLLVTHQLERDLPWLGELWLLDGSLQPLRPDLVWENPASLWLARQLCPEQVWAGAELERQEGWLWLPPGAWHIVPPGQGWSARWVRAAVRGGQAGWWVECRGRAFFLGGAGGSGDLRIGADSVVVLPG